MLEKKSDMVARNSDQTRTSNVSTILAELARAVTNERVRHL
jgi:hypothetical protein